MWVRDFVSSTPTFNETRQSSVCISISQSEHVIGWRILVACSYCIYENFLSAHVFNSTVRAQMHFFMYVCVMCALSNKNIKNFWYLLRESRQRVRVAENSRTRHACWILLIVAKDLYRSFAPSSSAFNIEKELSSWSYFILQLILSCIKINGTLAFKSKQQI